MDFNLAYNLVKYFSEGMFDINFEFTYWLFDIWGFMQLAL